MCRWKTSQIFKTMCYDISFRSNIKELSDYFPEIVFEDQQVLDFQPIAHLFGHTYGGAPIIYNPQTDRKLHVKMMNWGCIPFFIKDLNSYTKQRATMINARSERILTDTKSYWYKIRNRRCLIPMNGFFEHRHFSYEEEVMVRNKSKVKQFDLKVPYYIWLKDQDMFYIPGLYSITEIADNETGEALPISTFTLITRAANSIMKEIHNGGDNPFRMPLLLSFADALTWVQKDLSLEDYKRILDFEMPASNLGYHTVRSIRARKEPTPEELKTQEFKWDKLPEINLV